MSSKLIYYVVASLDGYIATLNHTLEWLDNFEFGNDVNDYYNKFYQNIGAVIIGAITYKWILSNTLINNYPYYSNVHNIVLSNNKLVTPLNTKITFTNNGSKNIVQLAKEIAAGKNIWVVGGGKTVAFFCDSNLLNQIHVTILPLFLGSGIPILPIKKPLNVSYNKINQLENEVIENIMDIAI